MGNRHLAPALLACWIAVNYKMRCLAGPLCNGSWRHRTIALESPLQVCRPRQLQGEIATAAAPLSVVRLQMGPNGDCRFFHRLGFCEVFYGDHWGVQIPGATFCFGHPLQKYASVNKIGLQRHTACRALGPPLFGRPLQDA